MRKLLGLRLAAVGIVASATALVPGAPASAASGCSVDLCISTDYYDNPETHLGLIASPTISGHYHTHIWGGGNDFNTPEQFLQGGQLYGANARLQRPIPKGTRICAELWRRAPGSGGGWTSWGLPCITH